MFHSNQILDVTCEPRDLAGVIDFGINLYTGTTKLFTRLDGRVTPAVTNICPGFWILGTGSMKPYQTGPNKGHGHAARRGWQDLPFDYDPDIIAKIAAQWLENNPPPDETAPMIDGSVHPGFRVRSFHSARSDLPPYHERIDWDPSNTILVLSPCWLSYHK